MTALRVLVLSLLLISGTLAGAAPSFALLVCSQDGDSQVCVELPDDPPPPPEQEPPAETPPPPAEEEPPATVGSMGGGCGSGYSWNRFTYRCDLVPQPRETPGEVLGASVFIFTRDLHRGMVDADVAELQKFLVAHGYPVPSAVSQTFGEDTFVAVRAFQRDRGIVQTGYVGPLTRAKLNEVL